ncbi:MAG: DUF2723 domain-containing protein [Deltaproteobacteria bacterium]|nr:DUF2723 domain-containing protein [Deltaproteobacteria bacterium]
MTAVDADATTDPPPRSASPIIDGLGRWPWYVLGATLLGLAALSVPESVQAGDAGEMATVMLEGGVPHPSGYPWMRVLGLPASGLVALGMEPARAAAWPCALAGVVAWLLLWPMLVRWTGRPPATFAIALLATASPVLLHVNDAEVWGLHLLASAVVLRVADRDPVRPWQLGLCFGLALSHHLSAALLLPVVVGAAWPRPFGWRRLGRVAAQGIGAGLAGLLPLATLALGSGGAWRWGDTQSLSGLARHVLRADYGVFELSLHQTDPLVLDQWTRVVDTVGTAMGAGLPTGPMVGAMVLGVVALAALRCPTTVRPGLWWGLWGSVLASTLAFPAAHNIDPTRPFGAWILERFDLLTLLLWTPLLAVATARLLARVPAGRLVPAALTVAAMVLVATQTARSFARGVPSTDDGVERYARDLLQTPAPGQRAVVIGTDDHRLFPIVFMQHVRGASPDTLYIDASLLSQPWYRAHLREHWPALPDVDKPVALIATMWRDPALRDTPIYLANVFSRPAMQLPILPQGLLWRVLPPHDRDVGPSQVLADHLATLARYGPLPNAGSWPSHPWTADLHAAYNEGTAQLVTALRDAGRELDARALLDTLGDRRPPSR